MCSYLSQALELRVVQHYVGADGQTVVREHVGCLEAGGKLPSYVLEDSELTELCVRAHGDEDWSQDVRLDRRESSVVQVGAGTGRQTHYMTHHSHRCLIASIQTHPYRHIHGRNTNTYVPT